MSHGFGGMDAYLDVGEGHISLDAFKFAYATQGCWIGQPRADQILAWVLYNSSNTQNDQVDFLFTLSRGVYTLGVLHMTTNDSAICTVLLNGSVISSFDMYSAGTVFNVRSTIPAITTVYSTGQYVISLKAATRNASALGWYLTCSSICMWRTA